MQKNNDANIEIKNWTYFTTGLLASWFLAFFFFTMPFGFIIWLVCLIRLYRSRSRLRWFLIIFSGWVGLYIISFSIGVKDYLGGQAEFIGGGLPGPESKSLSRKYRVSYTSSGCMLIGFELITNPARNVAIRTCVTLFGYQKGSYSGYYPSRQEVKATTDSLIDTITFTLDKSNIIFKLMGKDYQIVNGWTANPKIPDSCFYAKATILREQIVVFRPICSDGYDEFTLLAEEHNGKPFAWYYDFNMHKR